MNHTPGDDRYDADQHDERLLARLRGADPAAGLAPLPEDAVGELLGSVTSTPRAGAGVRDASDDVGGGGGVDDAATTAGTSVEAPSVQVGDLAEARRRRQRRRWGGVAGLGLAAAAAGVIALTTGLPGMPGSTDTAGVTALRAAGPVAGGPATACAQLEAASLASFDVAFQGRVVEVRPVAGGEVVVLEVERVYRGDVEHQVEVSTPGAGSLLDGTVSLAQGGDYLVAASGGQVAGCGATGQTGPELGALYEQAFGAGR